VASEKENRPVTIYLQYDKSWKNYYEYDKDLHMIFIDFKYAYDSINRNQLWVALEDFGFPSKFLRLIRNCNSNTFCRVRFLGETSTQLEVRNGIRQGNALSPILINLALERVIREMNNLREMEMIEGNTLLAYADDIVILGESKAKLTTSTLNLFKSSEKMGLRVNEIKTKYMMVTRKPRVMQSLRAGQYLSEQVEDFKYLGVNINQRNNMYNEVKMRLSSANRGYHTMKSMLSSRILIKRN